MIPDDDDVSLADDIHWLGSNFTRSVWLGFGHMATKKCKQVRNSLAYAIKTHPNVDTVWETDDF